MAIAYDSLDLQVRGRSRSSRHSGLLVSWFSGLVLGLTGPE
jgi:hypothetical protein